MFDNDPNLDENTIAGSVPVSVPIFDLTAKPTPFWAASCFAIIAGLNMPLVTELLIISNDPPASDTVVLMIVIG